MARSPERIFEFWIREKVTGSQIWRIRWLSNNFFSCFVKKSVTIRMECDGALAWFRSFGPSLAATPFIAKTWSSPAQTSHDCQRRCYQPRKKPFYRFGLRARFNWTSPSQIWSDGITILIKTIELCMNWWTWMLQDQLYNFDYFCYNYNDLKDLRPAQWPWSIGIRRPISYGCTSRNHELEFCQVLSFKTCRWGRVCSLRAQWWSVL